MSGLGLDGRDWTISPGETLRDWMTEQPVGPATAADRCDLPALIFNGVLAGDLPITTEIAAALERGTGISSAFWLNLERGYRADLAADLTDSGRA